MSCINYCSEFVSPYCETIGGGSTSSTGQKEKVDFTDEFDKHNIEQSWVRKMIDKTDIKLRGATAVKTTHSPQHQKSVYGVQD